MLHRPILSLEE